MFSKHKAIIRGDGKSPLKLKLNDKQLQTDNHHRSRCVCVGGIKGQTQVKQKKGEKKPWEPGKDCFSLLRHV